MDLKLTTQKPAVVKRLSGDFEVISTILSLVDESNKFKEPFLAENVKQHGILLSLCVNLLKIFNIYYLVSIIDKTQNLGLTWEEIFPNYKRTLTRIPPFILEGFSNIKTLSSSAFAAISSVLTALTFGLISKIVAEMNPSIFITKLNVITEEDLRLSYVEFAKLYEKRTQLDKTIQDAEMQTNN